MVGVVGSSPIAPTRTERLQVMNLQAFSIVGAAFACHAFRMENARQTMQETRAMTRFLSLFREGSP
jgi:hypothetical protein